jgi:DNA-binding NarL/FixJ family response regulator
MHWHWIPRSFTIYRLSGISIPEDGVLVYRVLVVEDFAPWRRRICDELRKNPRWGVIGEVSDGLAAVREAQALKPDLILLDIGLPTLNGLEAARRILADDPASRILFLTEQRSPDIAEAGLRAGARGYLLKFEAGDKLQLAMETVVNGGRFVSSTVQAEIVEATREIAAGAQRHEAVFHSDETSLVDDYVRFAETALRAGKVAVFVVAGSRLGKIRDRLEARGVGVKPAIAEGRYVALDAASELSKLTADGWPNDESLRLMAAAFLTDVAARANGGNARVAVCGELAPDLWKLGRPDDALRLERAWDCVARRLKADVLCGYLLDSARLAENSYTVFRQVCAEHAAVSVR